MTTTVKLSQPLKTHTGTVSELTLSPPTARLLIQHGDPVTIRPVRNDKGEIENYAYDYKNAAMVQFAADMTGVDEIALGGLAVSDFLKLRSAIADVIFGLVNDKAPLEQPNAS